jgi:DNA replicative helicase MCM subunit Mcm2 (Cdc46/Mcm family)
MYHAEKEQKVKLVLRALILIDVISFCVTITRKQRPYKKSSLAHFFAFCRAETIELETLTRYIKFARENIQPVLSDDVDVELENAYVEMRRLGS